MVEISEVGKPAAGEHELLVKLHATTVNRTDCHYRSGKPWIMRPLLSGLTRPRTRVLGNEFAGQVVAAGNGVTSFQVGDRVFGYTEGPFGAHAEYLVIGEDGRVAVIPAALGYQQAVPATEGAHYALSHIRRAKIGSGHNVLVYGATGAIGETGRLMQSGQFTPVIDRQYPLDQIVDAYRYVETGQKIGNVVIIVDSSR